MWASFTRGRARPAAPPPRSRKNAGALRAGVDEGVREPVSISRLDAALAAHVRQQRRGQNGAGTATAAVRHAYTSIPPGARAARGARSVLEGSGRAAKRRQFGLGRRRFSTLGQGQPEAVAPPKTLLWRRSAPPRRGVACGDDQGHVVAVNQRLVIPYSVPCQDPGNSLSGG